MLIGYVRVSKSDGSQVLDLQMDAMQTAGVDPGHIYSDKASGKNSDRAGFEACLKALREGDTLVTWKLDRVGRSVRELIVLSEELQQRGIGLRILAGVGAGLDTSTAAGKAFYGIMAVLAEWERDVMIERTRAGLAAARARGRAGGRPAKMTPAKLRLASSAAQDRSQSIKGICDQLGISTATFYRYLHADGRPTAAGEAILKKGRRK
ncbi:recombinase family protein [Inquilinus sp. NPDC058860]|uniref:recombinase family protein n=1 Tax=Inquilinus sp. NPDC058860 TaxID=3346652 RepID=UPI0036B468C8